MTEHNWSGWPGAWCLDCGCEDPREIALAEGDFDVDADGHPLLKNITGEQMECKEPGSGRFDPYKSRLGAVGAESLRGAESRDGDK